jgi:hypothetical protein
MRLLGEIRAKPRVLSLSVSRVRGRQKVVRPEETAFHPKHP